MDNAPPRLLAATTMTHALSMPAQKDNARLLRWIAMTIMIAQMMLA